MAQVHTFAEQGRVNPLYKWHVMVIVMIGTMMATLDTSIVNVSIPRIMSDFGVNVDDIEWVLTGYMISFASLMPLTAWIRDRIGYKTLYLSSLFVFTAGSLLCGLSPNLASLIVSRVIQALGGGAIMPTGMAMITEVFPPEDRGKAMGIWGVGVIVGPAIGPTLGGYLTETLGWRSIFLVNLPIGIIGFLLAMRLLIKDRPHKSLHRPFDVFGFVFLTLFLVAFLLALSKGEREGWTSVYITTCFILSVVGLVGFFVVETQIPDGIIDIRLFRFPIFSLCSFMIVVRSLALFGGIFLLPIFLQQILGYDEIQTGLMLMPTAIIIGILMPLAGRLSDQIGARVPTIIGVIFTALFMFMYRNLSLVMSVWDIVEPLLVRGIGQAFIMAPIMATALNAIPQRKAGMGSSMLNILMQVGGSTGIAIFGTVLTNRITFHTDVIGSTVRSGTPVFQEVLKGFYFRAHDLGYPSALAQKVAGMMTGQYLRSYGTVQSYQDAFIVGAVVVILSIIPAFFLPGIKAAKALRSRKVEPEAEEISLME
jgi:DHA2 family multidrug resistance protein